MKKSLTLRIALSRGNWFAWTCRIVVGLLFIYSGFVKGIDPWGTIYKMEEYMAAMQVPLIPSLVILSAFALFMTEFLTGLFILLGCFRRGSAWMALIIMAVMLPLSLWIYVKNPVEDCGCFGDAWVISNAATFWKNVVLTVMSLWLVGNLKKTNWLVAPSLQWMCLLASTLYIFLVGFWGYSYQPLLDFRPYPVGRTMAASETESEEPSYRFLYSRNGVTQKFALDSLPSEEEGWEFVDRLENTNHSSVESADGLRIWLGEEDVTSDVLYPHPQRLLLLIPDLSQISIASSYKINSLYDWAEQHDIDMFAVVAGSEKEIEEWTDLSLAPYPIYTADDTQIKELVRGNPAVVFIKDDVIAWKSSLRAIDADDFLDPTVDPDPMSFYRDNQRLLLNVTLIFATVLALLIFLSFTPGLARRLFDFTKKKLPRRHEHS